MNKDIFRSVVQPYSMTSAERIDCLYDSLEFVRTNNIQGDYVECGVWKGGNIFGMLKYLEHHNNTTNNVWLYDTFSGMTAPESIDKDLHNRKASDILDDVLCDCSLDEVQALLSNTSYPKEKIKYVIGDVCKTLHQPENIPEKIALLRLDTDWYDSTLTELMALWDRLEIGAPCIIDDYGHWAGCKAAVHEFFSARSCDHEVECIDYTGIRIFKRC